MIHIRPALETDWSQFYPFLIEDDKPLDSLEAAFARFKHTYFEITFEKDSSV